MTTQSNINQSQLSYQSVTQIPQMIDFQSQSINNMLSSYFDEIKMGKKSALVPLMKCIILSIGVNTGKSVLESFSKGLTKKIDSVDVSNVCNVNIYTFVLNFFNTILSFITRVFKKQEQISYEPENIYDGSLHYSVNLSSSSKGNLISYIKENENCRYTEMNDNEINIVNNQIVQNTQYVDVNINYQNLMDIYINILSITSVHKENNLDVTGTNSGLVKTFLNKLTLQTGDQVSEVINYFKNHKIVKDIYSYSYKLGENVIDITITKTTNGWSYLLPMQSDDAIKMYTRLLKQIPSNDLFQMKQLVPVLLFYCIYGLKTKCDGGKLFFRKYLSRLHYILEHQQ